MRATMPTISHINGNRHNLSTVYSKNGRKKNREFIIMIRKFPNKGIFVRWKQFRALELRLAPFLLPSKILLQIPFGESSLCDLWNALRMCASVNKSPAEARKLIETSANTKEENETPEPPRDKLSKGKSGTRGRNDKIKIIMKKINAQHDGPAPKHFRFSIAIRHQTEIKEQK